MADPHIIELIADRLVNGLQHPGDPENGKPPMLIDLPLRRTPSMSPQMYQNIQASVKLWAEAIVYLIETDGNSDIILRTPQIEELPQ